MSKAGSRARRRSRLADRVGARRAEHRAVVRPASVVREPCRPLLCVVRWMERSSLRGVRGSWRTGSRRLISVPEVEASRRGAIRAADRKHISMSVLSVQPDQDRNSHPPRPTDALSPSRSRSAVDSPSKVDSDLVASLPGAAGAIESCEWTVKVSTYNTGVPRDESWDLPSRGYKRFSVQNETWKNPRPVRELVLRHGLARRRLRAFLCQS